MVRSTRNRVLVLGAGRGQIGVIRALKRLGATVVVATQLRTDLPGIKLADELVECDLRDPDAVISAVKRLGLDGVVTTCMDTAMPALGVVVESLGLRGVSAAAARMCNDKVAMKRQLLTCKVPTADFAVVDSQLALRSACDKLQMPAIVKAADLQGSNGVTIVHDEAEAQLAYNLVRKLSMNREVLIERFLEGDEFGAQAFVHDGEVLFVLPHADKLAGPSLPVPVEHLTPMAADTALLEEIIRVSTLAIKALGLDNCAVNLDFMLCDGSPYLIELTGRAGANGLPELTSAALGIDYYELISREALNMDVLDFWHSRTGGASAVLSRMISKPGLVGRLRTISVEDKHQKWLYDRTLFVAEGYVRQGFFSSNDCLGQLVVTGADAAECSSRADLAEREISFRMEPA